MMLCDVEKGSARWTPVRLAQLQSSTRWAERTRGHSELTNYALSLSHRPEHFQNDYKRLYKYIYYKI